MSEIAAQLIRAKALVESWYDRATWTAMSPDAKAAAYRIALRRLS